MRISNKESGVALVIGAILIMLVLIMSVLIIDLATVGSAANQIKSQAKLAALSAIQRYYEIQRLEDEEDDVFHQRRLDEAYSSAKSVLGSNQFLKSDAIPAELSIDVTTGARLIPGAYNYDKEACATTQPTDNDPPCFVRYDGNANETVTAMLIQGELYPPVKGFFNKISGNPVTVKVNTVATVSPRLLTVILDRSLSTEHETHIPRLSTNDESLEENGGDGNCFFPSVFAYPVFDPENDDAGNQECQTWPVNNCPYFNPVAYPSKTLSWCSMRNFKSRESGFFEPNTDRRRHHPDDYGLYTIFGFGNSFKSTLHPDPDGQPGYSTANYPTQWMIDTYRDDTHHGPEPFLSIIKGVRATLDSYQKTIQLGDSASLITFTDRLLYSQIVLPTKKPEDFAYLKSLVNVQDSDVTLPDKTLQHGIFPVDAPTNIHLALREAKRHHQLLGGEKNVRADIVLVTDGINNCAPCSANLPGFEGIACEDKGMGYANGYQCYWWPYKLYEEAKSELEKLIADEFVDRMTLSVILVGPSIAVRNIEGGGVDGCISFADAVKDQKAIFPVELLDTQKRDAYKNSQLVLGPFYDPAFFWGKIAAATGGIAVGVRDYSGSPSDPNCSCGGPETLVSCSNLSVTEQIERAFAEVLQRNAYQIAVGK